MDCPRMPDLRTGGYVCTRVHVFTRTITRGIAPERRSLGSVTVGCLQRFFIISRGGGKANARFPAWGENTRTAFLGLVE